MRLFLYPELNKAEIFMKSLDDLVAYLRTLPVSDRVRFYIVRIPHEMVIAYPGFFEEALNDRGFLWTYDNRTHGIRFEIEVLSFEYIVQIALLQIKGIISDCEDASDAYAFYRDGCALRPAR